jgi:hypothetical protein
VPERRPFEYAVVRVVPRIERAEFVNAGVVLYSRAAGFLGCRIALDDARLRALVGPGPMDLSTIEAHLSAMRTVCAGDPAAGPIAALPPPERYHWLVSPRSTAIQISPVHGGLTDDPAAALDRLFATLVSTGA